MCIRDSPHGITDMIHAVQYNSTNELLLINGVSLVTSYAMSDQNPLLLDGLFMASSIVHFRHDMPTIRNIPKSIFSALLITSFIYEPNILFLYMLTSHVPNHYKTNWKFINNEPQKNVGFILLFTLVLSYFGEAYPWIYTSNLAIDLSKGLIISHIIYDEKYIFHNHLFSNDASIKAANIGDGLVNEE